MGEMVSANWLAVIGGMSGVA